MTSIIAGGGGRYDIDNHLFYWLSSEKDGRSSVLPINLIFYLGETCIKLNNVNKVTNNCEVI